MYVKIIVKKLCFPLNVNSVSALFCVLRMTRKRHYGSLKKKLFILYNIILLYLIGSKNIEGDKYHKDAYIRY